MSNRPFLAARVDRFARTRPVLLDGLLAGAVWVVAGLPSVLIAGPLGLVVGTATVLPLAVRRRFPRTVLAWSTAIFVVQLVVLLVPLPANLAQAVVVHTIAAHVRSLAVRLTALVAATAGCLVAGFRWSTPPRYVANAVFIGVVLAVLVVLVWLIGNLVRGRTENLRALAESRHRDERLAAAREIHDLVAHSLTVVVVQADAGAFGEPRQALETIGRTARSALADVREVVEMLRDPAPVSGAPVGLGDVERIADMVRAAGVPVTVAADGPTLALMPPSMLRVIREALTNVVKHAGVGAAATVTVGMAAGVLRVRIDDDGAGGPIGRGPGVGIAGMRERLHALHGTLEAGPLPAGGFRVEASVPVGER
ncbi:sensor histidine kinase [Paractinoplanes lichenicola]|uniref:histidine kinase n=1 Tax=Paractinoplanes lichenicola TaxID=2802976 RepID=A0ABS1VFN0_9ACTN|nr:histidine kinase [Actinoplanes lichenicola]MBL7253504.1 hypothetical protein [Actinoplanes lichenicola]